MRTNTKIGDVFSVELENTSKKYFQYITNDLTQLNSCVIRAFKREYSIHEIPEVLEIVKDEVDFYVHVFVKLGIKMNLWKKEGNTPNIGKLDHIVFKDTNDYGIKLGDMPVKTSNNWHIWRINDQNFTRVGKLEGDDRKAYIGLVINPRGIIELLNGHKYPPNYPD